MQDNTPEVQPQAQTQQISAEQRAALVEGLQAQAEVLQRQQQPRAPQPVPAQGVPQPQFQAPQPPQYSNQPPVNPAPTSAPSGTVGGFNVSHGDQQVQAIHQTLQSIAPGIDIEQAVGLAVREGNPALINSRYLDQVAGQYGAQAHNVAVALVQAVQSQSEVLTREVHNSVGGEQNWNSYVEVFNNSAPLAVRQSVAALLESRDPNQIKAGAAIVADYGQRSGRVPQFGGASLNATPAASTQGAGLSKEAFFAALKPLDPNERGYTEKVNALIQQRQLGKQNGLA